MTKDLKSINKNAKSSLEKAKNILDITKKLQQKDYISIWKDKETGLIWEVKSSANKDKIYSYEEAKKYVEYLNATNYSGFNNWEIPSINDLETLFSKESSNGLYIKKELSKNSDWAYWSSTEIDENKCNV